MLGPRIYFVLLGGLALFYGMEVWIHRRPAEGTPDLLAGPGALFCSGSGMRWSLACGPGPGETPEARMTTNVETEKPWEQLVPLIEGNERRAARSFVAALDALESIEPRSRTCSWPPRARA